ncbi:MAG: cell division protein FtsZ, partial [Bacteroidota bacterium]
CNTDQQALDASPVPHKIQLGASLTEGRGAGSIPEMGRNAAIENIDGIKEILGKSTKMAFITAGMGGGTGTGAAPVIAKAAKEMDILTVGIVTMPFFFEGRKRRQQAEAGIEAIREAVDTLLVINNDKLREMYGNLSLADAFAQADDVLTTAAKGIAEIITRTGYINVDFEDVRTVMHDSGVAVMGSAVAEGEDRAMKAVEKALVSPLLNDNNIEGARYVLLNITFGNQEVLMDEISDITDFIQDEAGSTADVIWGYGIDENLGDGLSVTVIATGFKTNPDTGLDLEKRHERKVVNLNDDVPTTLTQPVAPAPAPEPVANTPTVPEPPAVPEEPYLKPARKEPVTEQPTFEFGPTAEPEMASVPTPAPAPEPAPAPAPEPETVSQEEPQVQEDQAGFEPYLKSTEPAVEAEAPEAPEAPAEPTQGPIDPEEQQKKANDRILRLRDLSIKLRTPSGISDLENEPAYKRRNVHLEDTPHSSESQVSRYTLSEEEGEDGEKKTGLRPNNSFLHDNVD